MRKVIAYASLPLLGLASAYLALKAWDGVVGYRSPYAERAPALSRRQPLIPDPPARKLVFIVVDGLREDVALADPAFRALASRGAFYTARTGLPSLSLPGWTYLLTGAPQWVSGVTTNWEKGPVRMESLFSLARAAGMSTALAGDASWERLFGPDIQRAAYFQEKEEPTDTRVAEAALELYRGGAGFLLVHLPDVDKAGHRYGSASPEYRQAAATALSLALDLSARLGPDTLLVLTADHGHIPAGGHGGGEPAVRRVPLVLAGPGVRPGTHPGEVPQGSATVTVAALLGFPRPALSTDPILADALDITPSLAEEVLARSSAQRASTLAALAEAVSGTRVAETEPGPRNLTEAAAAERRTEALLARALASRARRETLTRALLLLPIAALWLLVLALASRRAPAAGLGALWAGLILALLSLLTRGFSLSAFNTEADVNRFILRTLLISFAAALLLSAVLGALGRSAVRAGSGASGGSTRVSLKTLAWSAFFLALPAIAFLARYGVVFRFELPDFSWGMATYSSLLSLTGLGLAAPLGHMVEGAWGRRKGSIHRS